MAPSREIEKLQRRWQENRLGLTFAPLAEAYRKEGMLPEALELLEAGLAHHPNYVPAHIVRGRCWVDSGSDAAAEASFGRVLDLDPENGIALKGLAEIAERAGRYADASRRLEKLLDFDRNNEEARSQWDRVRSALGGSTPAVPEPVVEPEPEPAAPPSLEVAEVVPALSVSSDDALRAEIVDDSSDQIQVLRYDPIELFSASSTEYQQPGDSESLLVANSALTPAAPASPVEPVQVVAAAPPDAKAEVQVEAEAPAEADTDTETEVAESLDADDRAAVTGVEAEPDLVVTETMAEIFLRQGHRELALAVYSQLVGRSPDDQRIREAIGRLEAELKPAGALSLPGFAAVLTGGTSVRSFFEQLLSATRPRAPEAKLPPGLSLGAVFGEDRRAQREPTAAEAGPSFDEFYAEEPGAEAATAGILPGPDELAPGDDLESFTGWLKGLRR